MAGIRYEGVANPPVCMCSRGQGISPSPPVSPETGINLPNGEVIYFQALARAGAEGNRQMPDFFFDAVHYGVTASDPGVDVVSQSPR